MEKSFYLEELQRLSEEIKLDLKRNKIDCLHLLIQQMFDFHLYNSYILKDIESESFLAYFIFFYLEIIYSINGIENDNFGLKLYEFDQEMLSYINNYMSNYSITLVIERMLVLYQMGAIDIEVDNYKIIKCIPKIQNYMERYDLEADDFKIQKTFKLISKDKKIISLINENVSIYKFKWIQFSPNYIVDTYFLKKAEKYINSLEECHHFYDSDTFFGVSFFEYKRILTVISTLIIRNTNYAHYASKKYNHLKMIDILSLRIEEKNLIKIIKEYTNIDEEKTIEIIEILLTDLTQNYSFLEPKYPPLLIKASKNFIMIPLYTFFTNPFLSLFQMLKYKCSKDWDRATINREKIYRTDLYNLFSDDNFIKINSSVKIKSNNITITDIDACVYDKKNKTLALFQLKWNEPFGASLTARESRMKNYLYPSNQWVNQVNEWLNNVEDSDLSRTLGIKKHELIGSKKLLFVVGKYANEFTSDFEYNKQACWISFPMLKKLMNQISKKNIHNPLQEIYNFMPRFREEAKKSKFNFSQTTYKIDDYRIIF